MLELRKGKILHLWRLIFIPLLILTLLGAGVPGVIFTGHAAAAPAGFTDLPAGDPVYPYVQFLARSALLSGYPDGSFRPGNFVTRAEMAVMLYNAQKLSPYIPAQADFNDLNSRHWAYPYIEAAVAAGLFRGYPDGSFQPDAPVTRAQTAVLLWQLSKEPLPSLSLPESIQDVPAGHWAYPQIAAGLEAGLMEKAALGAFAPDAPATRAQVAKGLAVMLNLAPEFAKTSLSIRLTPLQGRVGLTSSGGEERILSDSVNCFAGDTIKTGGDGQARLDFPDGSSILVVAATEISIIKAQGQSYIKRDGSPGVMVDGLEIKLAKGRIFSGLAANYFYPRENPASGGLNAAEIKRGLPDEEDERPWWETEFAPRERLTIDMPWGVAGVRGTISSNSVNSRANSASVLDGRMQVTGGGHSIEIYPPLNYTAISGPGLPPSNPAPMPASELQAWIQAGAWLGGMMEQMMQNTPLDMTSAENGAAGAPGASSPEQLQAIFNSIMSSFSAMMSSYALMTPAPSDGSVPAGGGGGTPSSDASLSSLTISAGILNPAFDPGTYFYTVSVPYTTGSVTVTPTVHESHATVAMGASILTSGSPSPPVALSPGVPYAIALDVTAQDGTSTKTYTITVTRSAGTGGSYAFAAQWGSYYETNAIPGYTAVDSLDYIYVSDQINDLVYKFDANGNYISQWGSPGSGDGQFDNPTALAVDSHDNIYVIDSGNYRIQKFNAGGSYITQWGSAGSGDGQFDGPTGLAFDGLDYIYVADGGNDRIQKFDATGNYIAQWGSYGSGNGQFDEPSGVAADSHDNIYVADRFNDRIQKFDADGNYIIQWGSAGGGDGQFNGPKGIAVDGGDNIYVGDGNFFNDRIQKFDANGSYITQWGSSGIGDGQFDGPTGLAVDSHGNIYVSDAGRDRIQKFAADGSYITQWGSPGSGDGQFHYPQGLAFDSHDNLYVSDFYNDRIQKFDANGTYITQWGSSGSGDGQFDDPQGVAVDSDDNIYVVDCLNNRVQKFDSNGNYITQWGSPGGGSGQFDGPLGIAVDGAGSVYVVDGNPTARTARVQKFVFIP